MTSFTDYLQSIHGKDYVGTDDCMPDDFNDWLQGQDVSDIIKYGEKYAVLTRRELVDEISKKINKEIKEGNPLIGGSGICRCVYDGDGKRYGMCMRCANDSFYAHRKGELHFARALLRKLEEKV